MVQETERRKHFLQLSWAMGMTEKDTVSSSCYNKNTMTRWFNQQTSISPGSGGWKSEIRVPAWLSSR